MIGFVTWPPFLYHHLYKGQVTKPIIIVKIPGCKLMYIIQVRGHLQTEFSTLNVIITFRGDRDVINLNTLYVCILYICMYICDCLCKNQPRI